VLKSTTQPCENFRISGFRAKGFAALLSIGSEVGTADRDDPKRTLFVRGVTMENCSALACSSLVYIKPGGVELYDYRDGLVEDVLISNSRIEDPAGLKFRNGVYVNPGRGATVRRLTIRNLTVRARGRSPAVRNIAPVYLYVLGTQNGVSRGGSIEDVVIEGLRSIDPYGGVARSASTPGEPIHSAIVIEKLNRSVGHVGRVDVDGAQVDGSSRMAVHVGPNVEGPIRVSNSAFRNFAAAVLASGDAKAVNAHSPVELVNVSATPGQTAPAGTRGLSGA
jgi:hypothetical protein